MPVPIVDFRPKPPRRVVALALALAVPITNLEFPLKVVYDFLGFKVTANNKRHVRRSLTSAVVRVKAPIRTPYIPVYLDGPIVSGERGIANRKHQSVGIWDAAGSGKASAPRL